MPNHASTTARWLIVRLVRSLLGSPSIIALMDPLTVKIISSNNSTILPLLLITLPVARRGFFFFFLFLYIARVAFYSRRTRGSRRGVLLMPSKKSVLDGSRFGCVRYIIFDTFNTFEMSRYIMDS